MPTQAKQLERIEGKLDAIERRVRNRNRIIMFLIVVLIGGGVWINHRIDQSQAATSARIVSACKQGNRHDLEYTRGLVRLSGASADDPVIKSKLEALPRRKCTKAATARYYKNAPDGTGDCADDGDGFCIIPTTTTTTTP
jgi:hypothetical protein